MLSTLEAYLLILHYYLYMVVGGVRLRWSKVKSTQLSKGDKLVGKSFWNSPSLLYIQTISAQMHANTFISVHHSQPLPYTRSEVCHPTTTTSTPLRIVFWRKIIKFSSAFSLFSHFVCSHLSNHVTSKWHRTVSYSYKCWDCTENV